MSAWGRTGRVALENESPITTPGGTADVFIDGKNAGWIGYPADDDWWAYVNGLNYNLHLPSLDAAVLWVLRRVDPALWRQERGEVVTVKRAVTLPSGCPSHYAWRFYGDGEGGIGYIHYSDFPTAVRAADRYARARYAEVLAS